MKLVSDMKEFLILNDFPSVNASISERSNTFQEMTNQTDQQLLNLKQELASIYLNLNNHTIHLVTDNLNL